MNINKDGFEHFDSHIGTSQPFTHLHTAQQAPKQKQFNYLVVQKMDVEGPSIMQKFVLEPLSNVGQSALQTTKNALTQLPSLLSWGAIGIFHKIQQTFQKEEVPKTEQEIPPVPEQEPENIEEMPVLFVVPKEILEAPMKERLEWIENHKANCEVFVPLEKPMKLDRIGKNIIQSSSSSSSTPDDMDCDVRRISQEFQSVRTLSDIFPSTQSLQSQFNQREKYMISEEDYKQISQQNLQVDPSEQPQNIILYPLLGEMIPRQQILDQIKNYQLEQSTVTVVQKNIEPIQTQEIASNLEKVVSNPEKFVPLNINGMAFEKQEQAPIIVKQQQKYEPEEERQLEALLEY